jgi:hypothetical protein
LLIPQEIGEVSDVGGVRWIGIPVPFEVAHTPPHNVMTTVTYLLMNGKSQ